MAARNNSFDVGLRKPKFTRYSSDSEHSSNYSDEDIPKLPKSPIPEKLSNGNKDINQNKTQAQTQSVPKKSTKKDPSLSQHNKNSANNLPQPKTQEQVKSVPQNINSQQHNKNSTNNLPQPKTQEQVNSVPQNVNSRISSKDKPRKSCLVSPATPRDSSISSVSSQMSESSSSSKKTRKKRKKKRSSDADDLQLSKELSFIHFPIEQDYDFRLVCSKCLVKQNNGANGFTLNTSCSPCAMEQLAVKKKSGKHWMKIRQRPKCSIEFSGNYQICRDFRASDPCKCSPCTFAHGEGEQLLWMYEVEKKFMMDVFIQKLRENNIVTNQMLTEAKSKPKFIPGLDISNPKVASEPKAKAASSSQSTMSSKNSYTKISFIQGKDIPSSKESIPTENNYFPEFHNMDDPSRLVEFPNLVAVNVPSSLPPTKNETQPLKDTMWPVVSKQKPSYQQFASMPKIITSTSNAALKPIHIESWPFDSDENPLKSTHDFQMFCSKCFPPKSKVPSHSCSKNILAFAEKRTTNWLEVRERKKVHAFNVDYTLCDSVTGVATHCRYGQEKCTFAHNMIELVLWNADKQENFDLTKFIIFHSPIGSKIFHFVQKYGTSFSFVCSVCFDNSKELVYQSVQKPTVCNSFLSHHWDTFKTLYYHPKEVIIKKNSSERNDFYKRCFSLHCFRKNCLLAHSVVEREVWMLLRDTEMTAEKFLESLQNCSNQSTMNDSQKIFTTRCPYKVEALCRTCYLQGKKNKHVKCGHSIERLGSIYFTNPGCKQIRKLPPVIPKNYHFTLCGSLKNNKCYYNETRNCTFAHSEEEIEVWKWMCLNNIKNLEDISVLEDKFSAKVVAGSSSILQSPSTAVTNLPTPHYCEFCNVSCGNNMEWENHCASHEHNVNVTCDQEQQWNYREPPWTYLNKEDLIICNKNESRQCLYSNVLDMYNLCPNAHGYKELEEWRKRIEWRLLRANMAKNPSIISYIDKLQEKCSNASFVMRENIPNIHLKLDGKKKLTSITKTFNYSWTFTVITEGHSLKNVALLYNKDRLYFSISPSNRKQNLQVLDANRCKLLENHWAVKVKFVGKMYGSFSQRVVFDFGMEQLLFQDLLVEVGTCRDIQDIKKVRKTDFKLWTPEEREIISLPQENGLLKKYKKPVSVDNTVTQDIIRTVLNRHNYVQKMHKLLYLEEFASQQKISKYNLCADMTVSDTIQEESNFVKSQPGTYFGSLPLSEELSEDTDIGKMILTNCKSVYIALSGSNSKVYEVEIVWENFKGCCRNKIFLSLTQPCIKDLGLHLGAVKNVEIQFQLYRYSFCLMHFALDNLSTIDIVFPDPVKNILSQTSKPAECKSKILNEEQIIAVKYILGQRAHFLCPFILNGAYGTGKTETLAQATMELLDTQPNCKILICTQCNSSADLFILKHLDKYMKKKKQMQSLLRLYYSKRYISTIPEEIHPYTILDKNNQLRNPVKKDVECARVVIITLEYCYQLIKLGLKGIFTHIFVDEAAQEYECKVLLPLTMATEDTYVVLSGDYHQMGVTIHSDVARKQGLGKSIMQRLFEHYLNHPFQDSECLLYTHLLDNYRSVQEITRFISKCFYGINTNLRAPMTLPMVSGLKPLQFYAVSGIAKHNANSTSYYNLAEVNQVSDCVHNIASNWPSSFGAFDPKDVCVVSAYRDQVVLIRSHLRQKGNMGQIVVEPIGNIPGKEFKVVIISTVRTHHCLDISSRKLADYYGENGPDFFFDKKLLNTAMTRAKYSIITVGDPVTLCAYGKCSTIWRIFLSHCSKLCSVEPPNITYNLVRHEVRKLFSESKNPSTLQTDIGEHSSSLRASNYKTEDELSHPVAVKISKPTTQDMAKSHSLQPGKAETQKEFLEAVSNKTEIEPSHSAAVKISKPTTQDMAKSHSLQPGKAESQKEFLEAVSNKTEIEPSHSAAVKISKPTTQDMAKSHSLQPGKAESQKEFLEAVSNKTEIEPSHSAAVKISKQTTQEVAKSSSLQPPQSKIQTETLNCTLPKPANVKGHPSKAESSLPSVIQSNEKATNCMTTKPVDKEAKPLGAEPLHPTIVTSGTATSPEILQLNLNQAVPLNYPLSKMDSLFSTSENSRIPFSFPSVFAVETPTENLTIGLSVYKVDQNFIIGVHWPDIQSYIPNKTDIDAGASKTVLALHPKQQLPKIPELYFTTDHTIGAMSCLMKVDRESNLRACSFHQTLIKPQTIITIEEIENHIQQNHNRQQLNILNYLQELTDRWRQLRLGNEGLHFKDPLINYLKSDQLLKEILIQVHIQIVRFLSKFFPKITPRAQLSFKEGPKLENWKKEHVSDALNSILLLQPFLQGEICQCKLFCRCLLNYIKQNVLVSTIPRTLAVDLNTWQLIIDLVNAGKFEDAQDVILNPLYHSRIAVAQKRLSYLSDLEFQCSNDDLSTYNLTFDPQIYFCKPTISFLDLLVQRMLVAAINKKPSPVTLQEIQDITKKLTKTIKMKRKLEKEAFLKKCKEIKNCPFETIATIDSVTDTEIEMVLPQLVSWSFSIKLDMLGSRSTNSDPCSLEFSQIEANVSSYCLAAQNQKTKNRQEKIESNRFTICVDATHWQRILSCLRSQDFFKLGNYVQSANSSAVMMKELYLPDYNINSEVDYCLEVYPFLNLPVTVKIVEDETGPCIPQIQLLHLTPNVSLCLLHRKKPLQCFYPGLTTDLTEYQQRLLTEVYHLNIAQHRSVILRDVTLVQENQFWTFTIPSMFLEAHNISLTPDISGLLFEPLQDIVCIQFSITLAKNNKANLVFHGYIYDTNSSESNVTVVTCVTDDMHSQLKLPQIQKSNLEILCWKPIHRFIADSIFNLSSASTLAKNISSRNLKPVKKSTVVYSVLEENEFAIIASEKSINSVTYLMHWFEDLASHVMIREKAKKSPILICTPEEHELDSIENYLQMEDLFTKLNVVRVADISNEEQPTCMSQNKIFLHEKLVYQNPQLMEEINAMREIYGDDFKIEDIISRDSNQILSEADVILCTCFTSRRSDIRAVHGIKQMIIFNAHLCPEVLAMIPISYYNIERLGLFYSSELTQKNSIVERVLQSCPETKVIFQ